MVSSTLRQQLPLILLVVLAAVIRFHALDRVPPGIYWDEALDARAGIAAVRTRHFKIFYPVGSGREGLWINLTGVSEALLGTNQEGLRFCAALAGVLAVLFTYLFTRLCFSDRIAIFATWFQATGFWHIWISRMCFRAVLVPFLLPASVYFLLRPWRQERERVRSRTQWVQAAAGGILFGLGFHTYIAFRFAPLLVAVLAFIEYQRRKALACPIRGSVGILSIWLGAAFATALPIGLYFLRHPETFWGRAQQVSVFSVSFPAKALCRSVVATLGMFNIQGDPGSAYNIGGAPHLLLPVGILFAVGITLAARTAFRRDDGVDSCRLLCAWFAIFLIPGFLTLDAPNAVRVIGVIPPVYIFAGLGADALYERLQQRKTYIGVLIADCMIVGAIDVYRYFIIWGRSSDVADAFGAKYVQIAQILKTFPRGMARYVITSDWGEETVRFLTDDAPSVKYIGVDQVRTMAFPCPSLIVPSYSQPIVFAELAQRRVRTKSLQQGKITAVVVTCEGAP